MGTWAEMICLVWPNVDWINRNHHFDMKTFKQHKAIKSCNLCLVVSVLCTEASWSFVVFPKVTMWKGLVNNPRPQDNLIFSHLSDTKSAIMKCNNAALYTRRRFLWMNISCIKILTHFKTLFKGGQKQFQETNVHTNLWLHIVWAWSCVRAIIKQVPLAFPFYKVKVGGVESRQITLNHFLAFSHPRRSLCYFCCHPPPRSAGVRSLVHN